MVSARDRILVLLSVSLLGTASLFGVQGCSPAAHESPRLVKLPQGTPPEGGPPDDHAAGRWEDWEGAELVLALYEPHVWGDEDDRHARVMVFADGRALFRIRERRSWRWYVARLGPQEAEALRLDTLGDLARAAQPKETPVLYCSAATDQPRTVVMVRESRRWRVHEVYALDECLDADAPELDASRDPATARPALRELAHFVRAFRRLDWLPRQYRTQAERWLSPRTELQWSIDRGDYNDGPDGEPKGTPWPDDLPSGPALAEGIFLMPIDGAYEDRLRSAVGSGALVRYRGERWMVQVAREHPGDETVDCVLENPRRSCR